MGHCVNYIIVDENADREIVFADISAEVAAETWQEGGSYSGNLDMKSHWHDGIIYDSYEEAESAIHRFDNGWYDDHAVLFRDTRELSNTRIDKLNEQIKNTEQKKHEYIDANHVRARKSALIGCPHCHSKLSKEYLRTDRCPLCETDLRSDTVRERIARFDEKIDELNRNISDERKKLIKKAPVRWLVKYEYHI